MTAHQRGTFEIVFHPIPAAPPKSIEGIEADSGVGHIAFERAYQVHGKEYDALHDDRHDRGELVRGAIAYLLAGTEPQGRIDGHAPASFWPWNRGPAWEPEADLVTNLAKAGAMIAAEIDRRRRLETLAERTRPMTVRKDDLEALLEVARAAVKGHVAATGATLADALDRVGLALEGP